MATQTEENRYINPYKLFTGAFIPEWLLIRTEISLGAKLTYAKLCQYAGSKGFCYPAQNTLASSIGASRRQVQNYLHELKKNDLIEAKRIGKKCTNRYYFLKHIWISDAPILHITNKSDAQNIAHHNTEYCASIVKESVEENQKNHQPQKSDVQVFIDFYFKEYQKKFGGNPPFKGGRDGKTVKTLLKVMTVDILKTTVIRFLETEDSFFKRNGYDIPRFEKYLDGIKCGAYEEGKLRGIYAPDDAPIDPATGAPAKTLKITSTRHSARDIVRKEFALS